MTKNSLVFLLANLVSIAASAGTTNIPQACYANAKKAVLQSLTKNYYDKNGFETYVCRVTPDNTAIMCDVSASKGDGAATDTYRVHLDKSCVHALNVELIGEE